MELDTIAEEIRLSYALIFGRSDKSKEIANRLFHFHDVKIKWINAEELLWAANGDDTINIPRIDRRPEIRIIEWNKHRAPTLCQFQILRLKLATLKQSMLEWKPQTYWELWCQPGYLDKFAFYTGRFAMFIGVLTVFIFGLTIAHTVLAAKSYVYLGGAP